MRRLRALILFTTLCALCFSARAQVSPSDYIITPRDTNSEASAHVFVTNGITYAILDKPFVLRLTNYDAVLSANKGYAVFDSADVYAAGSVFLEQNGQTFKSDYLHYNFTNRLTDADAFLSGRFPNYFAGKQLHGLPVAAGDTNQMFVATNGFFTADDYANPAERVRAKEIRIVSGEYVEAHNATIYLGDVPVFYTPYYRRSLNPSGDGFNFLPGYRSLFGAYLLSEYYWHDGTNLDGAVHGDWRQKRGFGSGPDFSYHFGPYGDGTLKYYYTHDSEPGLDPNGAPIDDHNRQRMLFTYQAEPVTNLVIKSQAAYESDAFVTRDFFESEYNKDVEPNTYVDVNKHWSNWSFESLAQPRVNDFFESVERLPEERLNGFRQQIGSTPLYYESQTTFGYYRRQFAPTNSIFSTTNAMGDFYGARADTFHQITMPETFFDWLNVTPRVGGRYTYYTAADGTGSTTSSEGRRVLNTGVDITTKLSQTWPGVKSDFFELDGLRHIIEPSIDYAYVPTPNYRPGQLPQYDYELTNSLRMIPLDFPDNNAIDSIDSMNTIRWGIRNRLQTKRDGQVDDFFNWGVFMDWNLKPDSDFGQTTFSDIFSDLTFKPRSWLTFNSFVRYDIDTGEFNLAQHQMTIQPNDRWSWAVGHYYLRGGPEFGLGDNLITSVFYYRFSQNWGFRMSHHFEARDGVMEEQYYSIYRDFRSWTGALTFRVNDSQITGHDYTVAFTFSLKSFPRFGLGKDTVNTSTLVGY